MDSIQFLRGGSHYGGTGGESEQRWEIPHGRSISALTVWSGKFVHAVQFHLNDGTESPRLGAPGGTAKRCEGPAGTKVVQLKGRDGSYVNSFGAQFA